MKEKNREYRSLDTRKVEALEEIAVTLKRLVSAVLALNS